MLFRKITLLFIFIFYLAFLVLIGYFSYTKIKESATTPYSPFLKAVEFFEGNNILPKSEKISYGFLPYWQDFDIENNYDYLTHLSYFAIFLKEDGSIDKNYAGYKSLVKIDSRFQAILKKAKSKKIHTELTVAIHEVAPIDKFLSCGDACFSKSFEELDVLVSKYGFVGINFDFEYQSILFNRNDVLYSTYVKSASDYFKKKYGSNFEISVSVYGDSSQKARITNLQELNSEKIDFLFVMSYDYVTRTSSIVGPSAPLSGYPMYFEYDVLSTLENFIKLVPAQKLVLGIPLYGLNFISENGELYSSRIPGDESRGYSLTQNLSQIYEIISREKIEPKYDETLGTYYFSYKEGVNTRIVFFEGEKSIMKKIDLIISNKLLGVGFWALGYDDNKDNYKSVKTFLQK